MNFWPATHQQIYMELKKLDDLGFVRFKEKSQKGRPDKKIYSITKTGIAELKEWVAQPTEITPSRDILLIKLFASHIVNKKLVVAELTRHEDLHRAKLTEYLEIEDTHFSSKKVPPDLMAQCLTLRRGILFEESWVKWCEECLNKLEIFK